MLLAIGAGIKTVKRKLAKFRVRADASPGMTERRPGHDDPLVGSGLALFLAYPLQHGPIEQATRRTN